MHRNTLIGLAIAASALAAAPAQAGVICSFSGTGLTGTDCLGQTWQWGVFGWGIPGIGAGVVPYPSKSPATDFHWECTFNCRPINFAQMIQVLPAPGALWNAAVNANLDQVDFTAPAGTQLSVGNPFFVNIGMDMGAAGPAQFKAWWTDDNVAQVPEPGSAGLVGAALLALARMRRRKA